jgi:Baseplate J-like protein
MATIVYLDADDEITSAASRIRSADDERVGLVLPFGSRVATSRINFRLLAREAQAGGRRLDIVAPDASARALAASAGLPVFASVGEYEAALDADDDAAETAAGPGGAIAAAGLGATAAGAGPGVSIPGQGDGRPIDPSRDTVPTQRIRAPITEPASTDYGAPGIGAAPQPRPAPGTSDGGGRRRAPGRGPFVVLLALLALLGAGAVAAIAVLPSADISVTPHIETIGPISFTVTADPAATTVDPAAGVIPATTVSIPVTASGEFPATGKKVVREKATGAVRFTNCDPSSAYRIPSGTIVRTRSGIGFAIDEEVFLPVAGINGNILDCKTSEVTVTAEKAGEEGNVDAGAIRVVPARYNRNLVRVTNPAATSGGSREEFPRVKQEDVDAAIEQLKADTQAQFESELENPDAVPEGTTVFPETATLTGLATDVDPATLVGQEVATFTLSMTGTGTVQAVDATPIEAIAEERLASSISDGYELVPGSISVDVGAGSVVNGVITFPVDGTAKQVRPLDAAALERQVLGLPKAEAEAVLAPYGDVVIVLWPGYVTSVPTMDARVTLVVEEAVDAGPAEGAPTPIASPTPEATAAASGEGSASPFATSFPLEESPSDAASSEPVPSG